MAMSAKLAQEGESMGKGRFRDSSEIGKVYGQYRVLRRTNIKYRQNTMSYEYMYEVLCSTCEKPLLRRLYEVKHRGGHRGCRKYVVHSVSGKS